MNDLYRTFLQIVESETLVRAADALHLTQPTISRQLQQLEANLKVQLFDRVGKRLVLNRAGELVHSYAVRSLALEQKLQDELGSFTNPETGTVYLGAGLTPSIYVLPQILAAYRKRYPHVQFQVLTGSSSSVYNMLMNREIDLGIVTTVRPDWTSVHAIPLIKDELLFVTAPGHPLALQSGSCDFEETLKYPFVLMRQGSSLWQLVVELAQSTGHALQVAMETDSLESINRLVQHSVGVSLLPRSSVQDDLLSGRLVEIRVHGIHVPSRMISLVLTQERGMTACAARFSSELPRYVHTVHGPVAMEESVET